MKFEVQYHDFVRRHDYSALDFEMRARIKRAIESKLMTQPARFGKPLRGSLKGSWKLRVGDYRIIFSIKKQIVYIYGIVHRSTVYKAVLARLMN